MSEHLYRMDYLRRLQAVKDRQALANKLITIDTPEDVRVPAVNQLCQKYGFTPVELN